MVGVLYNRMRELLLQAQDARRTGDLEYAAELEKEIEQLREEQDRDQE